MSVNVTQHKPSFDERLGKGFVDYAKRYEISVDDLTAGAFKIPVNPGEIVLGVRAQVLTAFNGTNPAVIVGDGADDNGYVASTDVAVGTVGSFYNSIGGANAYAAGKAYASGGALVATFAGSPTAGKLALSVIFDGYGAGPGPRREIKNL